MQGHLPNGNPVQRHRAGEHYPYVIVVVESRPHPRMDPVRWYDVVGPRLGLGYRFATAEAAEDFARSCARNIRA